jgi:CheY-like chemotaxis protein
LNSIVFGRPFEILLIEDDPADALLTREALKDNKILHSLAVVRDADEAFAYLKRRGRHAGAPRPDLILLDLKLPGRDGHEVLADIKRDVELWRIPVVVISGSYSEQDVRRAYDLGANCYITKPVDFVRFGQVVRAVDTFWLSVVTLPARA